MEEFNRSKAYFSSPSAKYNRIATTNFNNVATNLHNGGGSTGGGGAISSKEYYSQNNRMIYNNNNNNNNNNNSNNNNNNIVNGNQNMINYKKLPQQAVFNRGVVNNYCLPTPINNNHNNNNNMMMMMMVNNNTRELYNHKSNVNYPNNKLMGFSNNVIYAHRHNEISKNQQQFKPRAKFMYGGQRVPTASSPANTNSSSSSATGSQSGTMSTSLSNNAMQGQQTEQLSKTNLYIRGLTQNTTDKDLVNMCVQYGTITSTKAILDKNTNKCKGYGFVDFESPLAADTAVKALMAKGIQAQMAKVGIWLLRRLASVRWLCMQVQ